MARVKSKVIEKRSYADDGECLCPFCGLFNWVSSNHIHNCKHLKACCTKAFKAKKKKGMTKMRYFWTFEG